LTRLRSRPTLQRWIRKWEWNW